MRQPIHRRSGTDARANWLRPIGRRDPGPSDDPENVLALLEAIGSGNSAEVFRRALEKDLVALIARSLRLRANLALTPEVANPIMAEALASARAELVAVRDPAPGTLDRPRRDATG